MQRFARIADGVVVELVLIPEGLDVAEIAHPDVVASLVPNVPDTVMEGWLHDGTGFTAPPVPPAPEPAPRNIPAGVFFDRLTEEEAEQLDEAMNAKPVKYRRAWQAATSFDETTDLWPVLEEDMIALFGDERANALLVAVV